MELYVDEVAPVDVSEADLVRRTSTIPADGFEIAAKPPHVLTENPLPKPVNPPVNPRKNSKPIAPKLGPGATVKGKTREADGMRWV